MDDVSDWEGPVGPPNSPTTPTCESLIYPDEWLQSSRQSPLGQPGDLTFPASASEADIRNFLSHHRQPLYHQLVVQAQGGPPAPPATENATTSQEKPVPLMQAPYLRKMPNGNNKDKQDKKRKDGGSGGEGGLGGGGGSGPQV